MTRHYDLVMVTDARLPGGTSASVAEEIRAQAASGFRTGLLQIDSPLVQLGAAFSPRLRGCVERGEAEVIVGDEPVTTDLIVLRHPTVAASAEPSRLPEVTAAHRVLVVNQAPGMPAGPDADDDQALRYDPHAVDAHLSAWLGGEVLWAPIGPLVRENLAAIAPELPLVAEDWVNVIDVDAWARHRNPGRHAVPVIGRHSRNDPLKWPASRAEVLEIYPESDDVEVHVLGGAPRVTELFDGSPPANWVLRPFGSMPPERFLAGIDVYVYFHHPRLIEAFGRTILEALASGLPTILPAHFAPLFGEAALYAEPGEVVGLVHALHRDRERYAEQSRRGLTATRARFGHEVHRARIARYTTPSARGVSEVAALADRLEAGTAAAADERASSAVGTYRPTAAAACVDEGTGADEGTGVDEGTGADRGADTAGGTDHSPGPDTDRRRVLFVSSNGAGVGHLMRLMALSRHAGDDVEPLFLTFSQGAKVVDDAGYLVEYLASRAVSGGQSRLWHPLLEERMHELIERYDVRAVVFDGTWPYQGLLDAVGQHPGVRLVWSRRAMWKPGVVNDVLATQRDRFDLVLEPGELAEDEDRGATRPFRPEAVRVGPVTYLDADEVLERDAARELLGLDAERPAVLVNLGAGNINDAESQVGAVVTRLAREPQLQVCVTHSIIADRAASLPENVRSISVYPLARYLAAFDFAFAASGYNSYHELLSAAVPTAFVPNVDTATDDQAARARFAARAGVGIDLLEVTPETVDEAVRTLLDVDTRRRMHERAAARRVENGAAAGMDAITELIDRPGGERLTPAQLRAAVAARRAERQAAATPGRSPTAGAPAAPAGASSAAAAGGTGASPDHGAAVSGGEAHDAPTGPGTPEAAEGPGSGLVPAGERRTSPDRVLTTAGRLAATAARGTSRQVVRARRTVARTAKQERVQATLRAPYTRLPEPVKARVRQAVQRWEPPQTREQRPPRTPLPVPGGVLAATTPPDARRVLVVLPAHADGEVVAAVVTRTAQLQAAYRSFVPMFFTSSIEFGALRARSYLFEYFPPRSRWARVATDQAWYAARRDRLRTVIARFGVEVVVRLPEPAEDGVEGMLAELVATLEGLTLDA